MSASKRTVKRGKRSSRRPFHNSGNRDTGNGEIATSRQRCLQEVEHQYRLIRDQLRIVCSGDGGGMYLYGGPGIGKTHQVVSFLKDNAIPFQHKLGHITGPRLFKLLATHPDGVLVLDDVSGIFGDTKAVQLLLAALGSPPDGSHVRPITYGTDREERVVEFTGTVVAISNLGLDEHRNEVFRALNDRVHVRKFDPTPEQVEALVLKIAEKGPAGVAAGDAAKVAGFLAAECRERGVRLTIRTFVKKALPAFSLWKDRGTECHWEDLVRAIVAEELVPQRHAVRDISRRDRMDADRRVVLEICREFAEPVQRLQAWKERTGSSKTTFYNHQKKLADSGQLSRA
jgi:hypothetical protein